MAARRARGLWRAVRMRARREEESTCRVWNVYMNGASCAFLVTMCGVCDCAVRCVSMMPDGCGTGYGAYGCGDCWPIWGWAENLGRTHVCSRAACARVL